MSEMMTEMSSGCRALGAGIRPISRILCSMLVCILLSDAAGFPARADGDLLVVGRGSGTVLRYDAETGQFLDAFLRGNGGLQAPGVLAAGPDGSLYITDSARNSVLRYNGTTGQFLGVFVPPGSGGLIQPYALTFGPDGNLYVASPADARVLRYNGTTGQFLGVFVQPGSGGLAQPFAMVFGPDGSLYVSSFSRSSVLRYDGRTGQFLGAFVPQGSGGLIQATGMAFGPDGSLYVASYATDSVLRYDGRTGQFLNIFTGRTLSRLNGPGWLAFRPDRTLCVISTNTDSVHLFEARTGRFLQVLVSPRNGGLQSPGGLLIRPAEAQNPEIVPTRVNFSLRAPFNDRATADRVLAENGIGSVEREIEEVGFFAAALLPGVTVQTALTRLYNDSRVDNADPDYVAQADSVPNDALYFAQYGPMTVKAEAAWDLWIPVSPVTIAVVDTGVDSTHPDLAAKILVDAGGAVVGFDAFTAMPDIALDDDGHGTVCAGIAAAQINNGAGIAGIAGWTGDAGASDTTYTQIMPVKALDFAGVGSELTVSAGIVWAATHGARVISLSLSAPAAGGLMKKSVEFAWSKGCVLVAAAGNKGTAAKRYPAALPHLLAVAATDPGDKLTSFSSYGSHVQVAAPGECILGTMPAYPVYLNGVVNAGCTGTLFAMEYDFMSGTSQAAPHVAGEAALLLAQYPGYSNSLTRKRILTNVDPYVPYAGHTIAPKGGRINIATALADHTMATWETRAGMLLPIRWTTAAPGKEGTVYVLGGGLEGAYSGVIDTVQAYHPDSDTWTTEKPLLSVRGLHAAAAGPGGKIYIVGGTAGIPGGFPAFDEIYDTVTGISTAMPKVPTPRWGLAAVSAGGKIYAIGGNSDPLLADNSATVATMEIFDTATGLWKAGPPMSYKRYHHKAVVGLDGALYVLGGFNEVGGGVSKVEKFDPVTGVWTELPPLPGPRFNMGCATGPDGLIYLIGGYDYRYPGGGTLDTVQTYSPATGELTDIAPLGAPRFYVAAVTTPEGKIYAVGGTVNYSAGQKSNEQYSP